MAATKSWACDNRFLFGLVFRSFLLVLMLLLEIDETISSTITITSVSTKPIDT
jgi:hypothetical protein